MLKRFFLLTGIAISLFLIWFAISNYQASRTIAEENLRGLAHTLTDAIEGMAVRDPSLHTLAEFHPADIAFFSLIDRKGVYRFHSNTDLIGRYDADGRSIGVLQGKSTRESRITLGTGEKAYEFFSPVYLPGETLALRLVLHTYRADAVVRRAEFNMVAIFALLVVGWALLAILYRFSVREERHKVEMERRKRLAQLGEMGAMLAHEIRNPLAGIKGYAQVIEKRPREDRNAGFAGDIVRETLRLEVLVSDLLAYTGNAPSHKAEINLKELIDWAFALVCHEAEEQRVRLASECSAGIRVLGNRDRLGQVMLNLLKNSLQAMPDGGSLDIKVGVSGGAATIAVSDLGHGIDSDDMNRIFEPFFTTKARGTGLGLPLCKKIIEEHEGSIRLESKPGKGATVFVALPVMKERNKGGSHP